MRGLGSSSPTQNRVGSEEGTEWGTETGCMLGKELKRSEGFAVGLVDGASEGLAVTTLVGWLVPVGSRDGPDEGLLLGLPKGKIEGLAVGFAGLLFVLWVVESSVGGSVEGPEHTSLNSHEGFPTFLYFHMV